MSQCPTCKAACEAEQRFCGQCGNPLHSSGTQTESRAPVGYTPPHLANQILQNRSAIEGERKQVTVLFCDIADSTALAERIGADRMHGVLNQFFDLALNAVHQFEGAVNQFLGDGFMALFGAPLTYEDHARRGVLAALQLRDAIEAKGATLTDESHGLGIRMGLSTGFVVVGKIGDNLRMDYTAIGDTTNIAARLQSQAKTGQILITSMVNRLVQGIVQSDDLGSLALKGVAEPVTVLAVLRAIDQGSMSQTAFDEEQTVLVGRDSELAITQKAAASLASGKGSLISVLGEAGTGKSRLLVEAQNQFHQQNIRIVHGTCQSHSRLESYRPLREVVRQLLHIGPEVDSQAGMSAVADRMVDSGLEDRSPYIGALMGWVSDPAVVPQLANLDRLALNQQIVRTLRRLLMYEASQSPLLIVLDDWHWADESSDSTLSKIVALCNTHPLAFLIAARPDVVTPADTLTDAATTASSIDRTTIKLSGLSEDATGALAGNLLPGAPLSSSLIQYLCEQTAGNPFYLGELVQALREAGSFQQAGRPPEWVLSANAQHEPLPGTIEGVILARVDRLDESAKAFLKVASIIGRQFDAGSVAQLLDSFDEVSDTVKVLVDKGLLAIDTGTSKQRFQFTHPLIQKAVYDSILQSHRQQLHRQFAEALEQRESGSETHLLASIAFHYAEAKQSDQALKFLSLAGDRAREVAADNEALAHYELALRVAERLPRDVLDRDSRVDLHQKIGEALFRLSRHEQAAHHIGLALNELGVTVPNETGPLRRAIGREGLRLLCRISVPSLLRKTKVDENTDRITQRICSLLELRCWIDYFRDTEQWLLVVTMLSRFAHRQSSPDYRALSTALSSLFFDSIGWRTQADRLTRRSLRYIETSQSKPIIGQSHFFRGLCLYHVGRSTEMLQEFNQASQIFHELQSLRHHAMVDSVVAYAKSEFGSIDLFEIGREMQLVSVESGDEQSIGCAYGMLGIAYGRLGNHIATRDNFRLALDAFKQVPDYRLLVNTSGYWADYEALIGNWEQALSLCDQCEPLIQQYRLSGMFVTRIRMAKATALLQAVDAADSIQERSQLLKKARDACRKARRQGRSTRDIGAAESLRISAACAWKEGKTNAAHRYWSQCLETGEKFGFRFVTARCHYDMGCELKDTDQLQQALSEFEAMQAHHMVAECREALVRASASA